MKTSKEGLQLIAKHEGFRSAPYLCPAKVWTIGFGNTYYPNGQKVSKTDPPISYEVATSILSTVVAQFEKHVNDLVKVPLTQNQFDALVSFTYNLGPANLKSSTLLKRINANPNDRDIANQFARWNKAGGQVLNGLTKRRAEEAKLYFK